MRADLSSVGAGGGTGLATAASSLVRVAARHRGVLGLRIGAAAGRKGQQPAPPRVGSDKGRQRHALLSGKARDLAAAMAHSRASFGDVSLGFGLRRHLPNRRPRTVGGKGDGAPRTARRRLLRLLLRLVVDRWNEIQPVRPRWRRRARWWRRTRRGRGWLGCPQRPQWRRIAAAPSPSQRSRSPLLQISQWAERLASSPVSDLVLAS
jgi:hypothetical protein